MRTILIGNFIVIGYMITLGDTRYFTGKKSHKGWRVFSASANLLKSKNSYDIIIKNPFKSVL